KVCTSIIHRNPNSYFDITGASELGVIGAYLACKKTFTPIFKLQLPEKGLVNIYGCHSLAQNFKFPMLTVDTIFASKGTIVSGHNHQTPPPYFWENILHFCSVVFADIERWKALCFYLQSGKSKYMQSGRSNFFEAPKYINVSKNKVFFKGEEILRKAQQFNLISKLVISRDRVSFYFKNDLIKRYMTDFGVWLELYCYIKLKTCDLFHDVRLSVKIDWNQTEHSLIEIVNEIDITFFYKIKPCFLSCKLSEPSSEALQELSVYPFYFGGKNSKSILVILSSINKSNSYLYKRASNMNIAIIDGNCIKQDKFIDEIKKALNII
ncbi:MAG: DUF1887 family protein, partial [Clostridia bacterium]|nr:DUF1887 family protein [Clostridia bacterium]